MLYVEGVPVPGDDAPPPAVAGEAPELYAISTGRAGEGLVFAPDRSGWASFSTADRRRDDCFVFVRFAEKAERGFAAVEMLAEAGAVSLNTRHLRGIPLGRLEAAVNHPQHRARLRELIEPTSEAHIRPPVYGDDAEPVTAEGWPWWMYRPQKPRVPRLKLKVPPGNTKKPDSFFEQVAERFAYLSTVSARPATDLAEANGVNVTTVHGWVKEARRRGLLAPGERGRRS